MADTAQLAVIGDAATVQAFGALGVEAVPVSGEEEAAAGRVQSLSERFAALFVTEEVYRAAFEHISPPPIGPYRP